MDLDPVHVSLDEFRKIWDKWNIRGSLILSLTLQTILLLFAPLRKRTSSTVMNLLIWLVYLLTDWAPAFVMGLISSAQTDSRGLADNGDLLALWSTFLLVHSGGADTISAFSIEDNELGPRYMIGLMFQYLVSTYLIVMTLPKNELLVPTILVYIYGIFKSSERVLVLKSATLDTLKESMLKESNPTPDYGNLMHEYTSLQEAKLPTQIDMLEEPKNDSITTASFNDVENILSEDNAVKYAYQFYESFRGLFVDVICNFHELDASRAFFSGRSADDAYKVILIELNLMYEALYTKVVLLWSPMLFILRVIGFGLFIAALIGFTKLTKDGLNPLDVRITYTLLIGAVALELIALFMLFLSDRTILNIKNLAKRYQLVGGLLDRSCTRILSFLTRQTPRMSKIKLEDDIGYDVLDTPVLCRRWAESISAYSLISYCIKEPARKVSKPMGSFGFMVHILGIFLSCPFLMFVKLLQYLAQCCCRRFCFTSVFYAMFMRSFKESFILFFQLFGINNVFESYKQRIHVSRNAFLKQLWDCIFLELIDKSDSARDIETAKVIYEAKGDWVLQGNKLAIDHTRVSLMQFVGNVDYGRIILFWHIATDLCYYTEDEASSKEKNDYREFSKVLSDYVLHLLVIQPQMMSTVAGIGQIRFRDTCAEAEIFFRLRGLHSVKPGVAKLKQACEMVLEVNTDVKPIAVKEERSKSVLFDACVLVKELKKLEDQGKNKWEVMCKVWIELLCYAASHCRAYAHAQSLNKGGELITLVWLLMAHLGIGEQFQMNGATQRPNSSE